MTNTNPGSPSTGSETDTALSHLVRAVPTARAGDTVRAALDRLPGRAYESAEAVYVVDDHGRLEGLVTLRDLYAARPDALMRDVMTPGPPMVRPEEDQEHVASLALRHDLTAVPVVGPDGAFAGVVPSGALMEILRREHVEDLHRMAGVLHEGARAINALEASPAERLRNRLPWLVAGLAGSVFATAVMAAFEKRLEAQVSIAFFIPAIVYLADAVGTQSEALAVRGLSHSHPTLGRLLPKEIGTGFLIGLILGAIAFPMVLFGFDDARLAAAVALALVGAGTVATGLGLLLPWLFSRAGLDPAFGSGPIGTIIQDVLSLLIYFGTITVLVL